MRDYPRQSVPLQHHGRRQLSRYCFPFLWRRSWIGSHLPLQMPGRTAVSKIDYISNRAEIAYAVKVNWDAARYSERLPKKPEILEGEKQTKSSKTREASLRSQYPPLNNVVISKPCIIHDMHGVVLAWYLPLVLNDSRQVSVFTLVTLLRKPPIYFRAQ
jgi:hypothetical protein